MSRPNNKVVVYTGNFCNNEFTYIAKYILEEIFLFDMQIVYVESDQTVIEYNNKHISWPNIFFSQAHCYWLNKKSLPSDSVKLMDLSAFDFFNINHNLPIVFGAEGVSINSDKVHLNFDLFGTCFYFISLYDEVVNGEFDSRNRIKFSSTYISKNGLIDRPVCNEYISFLKFLFVSHFGLSLNSRAFTCQITQDVDVAYFNKVTKPFGAIKSSLSDIIKRKSFRLASRRLISFFCKDLQTDPNNTFSFFLDQIEMKGMKSIFYFISTFHNESKDKHVNSFDTEMLSLYESLKGRGHLIGLHPYYGSYNDFERLCSEKNYLQDALNQSGLSTSICHSRQHGLQFDPRVTFSLLAKIGVKEDSSVYFSEAPGFRASICFDYPVYDLVNRTELSLRESPLICMDTSYVSYLNCSKDFMLQSIQDLYKVCKYYDGDFVILWHNCKLSNPMVRDVFLKTMEMF